MMNKYVMHNRFDALQQYNVNQTKVFRRNETLKRYFAVNKEGKINLQSSQ